MIPSRSTLRSTICLLIALAPLAAVNWAQAATSGQVDVVLNTTAQAEIRIIDTSLLLTPSQADLGAGYITAEGPAGITVQLRSNSSTGAALKLRCADAAPQIALDDFLVRTQTPARGSGISQSTYEPVPASDQILWSCDGSLPGWTTVQTDVKIQGLRRYMETTREGDRFLSNTLVFTIVVQ